MIQTNNNCTDNASEKNDDFVKIPEDNKNLRITSNVQFPQNVFSENKNSRLSADFDKMLTMVGNLVEPLENNNYNENNLKKGKCKN